MTWYARSPFPDGVKVSWRGVMWERIGITLVNSEKKMNNALQKLTVEAVME